MKSNYKIAVTMLAGAAFGALAVHGLHAQAKPPIYVVEQIDVTNEDAYAKEYVPKARAIREAAGGRLLARGGAATGAKVTTIEGEPFNGLVVIQLWESMDKIKAWHDSAEYKENHKIGDKYAKFRKIAVEGLPQ
jgi:uncharacterized protein (DUF1330 family)